MKIGTLKVLKTVQGLEVKNEKQEPVTLQEVIITALTAGRDEKESGQEKLMRWLLAERVFAENPIELSLDEVEVIKKCVNATYPSPAVVGQVWVALEEAARAPKVKELKNGVDRAGDTA